MWDNLICIHGAAKLLIILLNIQKLQEFRFRLKLSNVTCCILPYHSHIEIAASVVR